MKLKRVILPVKQTFEIDGGLKRVPNDGVDDPYPAPTPEAPEIPSSVEIPPDILIAMDATATWVRLLWVLGCLGSFVLTFVLVIVLALEITGLQGFRHNPSMYLILPAIVIATLHTTLKLNRFAAEIDAFLSAPVGAGLAKAMKAQHVLSRSGAILIAVGISFLIAV